MSGWIRGKRLWLLATLVLLATCLWFGLVVHTLAWNHIRLRVWRRRAASCLDPPVCAFPMCKSRPFMKDANHGPVVVADEETLAQMHDAREIASRHGRCVGRR